jgi:hypothetical protein
MQPYRDGQLDASPRTESTDAGGPTTGSFPSRRGVLRGIGALGLASLGGSGTALAQLETGAEPDHGGSFDLATGNAPIELVIPAIVPRLLSEVRPGDATLVLRTTTVATNAWFDAIAPYSDTAIGVYSSIPRRPASERTDYNRNVAILYASQHVFDSLLPRYAADWDQVLIDAGLDPNDTSTDLGTPVGIGNVAGAAVVSARENDGMNQLGDAGGRTYNRRRYDDYTGYAPVNTPYELSDPRRWQPDIVTGGNGLFFGQTFVTPQLAMTLPYSYEEPWLRAPVPEKSYAIAGRGSPANEPGAGRGGGRPLPPYREQADEVLAVSAALTDHQKMTAEFFDDKIRSLGFSILFVTLSRGLSLEQFVQLDFLVNVAAFDALITVWENKGHYDAVRPFSAIRYLYSDTPLTAWGGPEQGTVDDITGREWRAYLQPANHPEYPSASAALCRAHATAATLYLGTDEFGWEIPVPAGSSVVEPGFTPSTDITLTYDTWDDFSADCGISRLWAGVHFFDSIPAGQAIGDVIGERAYDWVDAHIRGDQAAIEALRWVS